MNQTHFRGRKIFLDKGYPSIYWPGHPTARKHGVTYIHRVIAYEKFRGIKEGYHIHHIDGDVWNWQESNLKMISPESHASIHSPDKKCFELVCGNCSVVYYKYSSELSYKNKRNFCSLECFYEFSEVIDWPVTLRLF